MTDDPPSNEVETVEIRTGRALLSGTLTQPRAECSSAIIIHGATGVPQRFYRHFATWLSQRYDAAVLTYDYRDFGQSQTQPMRASKATMVDWGVHDQAAALDFVLARFPDHPVDVVGHSLGGQMLAFHAQGARVRRLLTVASGLPNWKKHPPRYMAQVLSFWFGHGPALVSTLGYLPGKLSGLGADVPAGVYWQWRRWCVSEGYFFGDIGTLLPDPALLDMVVSLIGISDDVMVPPDRVDALRRVYPNAKLTFDVVGPEDAGLRTLGHIAVFAARNQSVWPALVQRWDVSHDTAHAEKVRKVT
jgi:predicted alpha/beta hydrolase